MQQMTQLVLVQNCRSMVTTSAALATLTQRVATAMLLGWLKGYAQVQDHLADFVDCLCGILRANTSKALALSSHTCTVQLSVYHANSRCAQN